MKPYTARQIDARLKAMAKTIRNAQDFFKITGDRETLKQFLEEIQNSAGSLPNRL